MPTLDNREPIVSISGKALSNKMLKPQGMLKEKKALFR